MTDDVRKVYEGSDGDATRALYARLVELAPRGPVAMNLLRTLKASVRAKAYKGRPGRGGPSYRQMAYDKKDWSIGELCRALRQYESDADDVRWGWGTDPKAIGFEHVLYVDLPVCGQVSFHTSHRRDGHDYAGKWDGVVGQAADRICRWAQAVLDGREPEQQGETDAARRDGTEGAPTPGDARGPGQQALDV